MKPVGAIDGMRRFGAHVRFAWPRMIELVLVALLAVQVLRLVWTVLTPVGPLGEWRGRVAGLIPAEARANLFRSFDAFYPATVSAAPQTQNVTSLALTVYGVRINEGSGLGSAIVSGEDGVQGSYAVGDEIQPGVKLKAVEFDHIVIDRGGVEEIVYLDQSQPVTPVTPPSAGAGAAASPASPAQALTADALKSDVGFAPRMSGGRITGIVLSSRGPAFQAAGFKDGDIITQINGRSVGSAGDISNLQQLLAPGARISVMVERGASTVPIAILVPAQ